MRALLPFVFLLGFAGPLFSQASLFGSLTGTIFDESSKETIIGANIQVLGTDLGTSTDFDGFYSINNIPSGKYTIRISYIGYENMTISDVEIKAGEKFALDIVMSTNSLVLDEITVTQYRTTNSVNAVLLEVKQAKQVVSGVSSHQMARSQDNNAAQVMARIPGVTIVDGRFVMIRGLSERYNNVMINNAIAPSTEVDKRTFSFDLIPTSALDRMLVYKSGSPEYPGDYAGGVIKLFTVEDVEYNFTRLSLGVGYRVNTTLQPYWQSQGSSTDFLGFDNGFRRLPSSFPTTRRLQDAPRNAQLRQDAAHLLPNNFQPLEGIATPDYSVGLSLGRDMSLLGRRLSSITTINYSTSYQYNRREFNRFFAWEDRSQPIQPWLQFEDDSYEKQNRISIMSNWKWRLSDRSRITFKNLINQIGENETILRNGFNFLQRPDDDLSTYLLGYRSRFIYSGQLEGTHDISSVSNLHWVLGGSYLKETEPDLRRFRTFRPKGQGDQNFTMIDPPSSNLFDTGRYFGNLDEFSVNTGADLTRQLPGWKGRKALVKGGVFGEYRYRDFDSRYVSYLLPGLVSPERRNNLTNLPLEQMFSPENVTTSNGWVLEEGTRGIDSYTASNTTGAAYLSSELSFGRLDVSGGLRSEYNIQTIRSVGDNSVVRVNNPTFSLLPFLNTGYNLSDKSLVRLAYSQTVNRPEFRELAPFVFFDYKLDANRVGAPDLVPARIRNVDLRYETYPRPGETFSLGAFFKYFDDPIENRAIISTELPTFSYINADWAMSYGLELELRKSLRGITGSGFLDRFSVNANASIIYSRVDLGEGAAAVQDQVRPLQGQSPYIVNFAMYYEEPVSGFSAALVYNIFGDRIFSVGDVVFPTIYELSRNSLDLTFTKRFGSGVSLKLGIQNLLDAPYRFFEDSDRNEKITLDGRDNSIINFRRGQLSNLTLTFDLNKK